MGDFEWTGFGKFWLWFCLIVNVISGVSSLWVLLIVDVLSLRTLLTSPLLEIFAIVAEIAVIAGIALLLFKKQKLGYFVICGAQVASIVLCIFTGGLVRALFSAFISLGIMFLAFKDHWDELA